MYIGLNRFLPDDEIERLKTEVLLLRLVEAKGIVLTPHGKDCIGCTQCLLRFW